MQSPYRLNYDPAILQCRLILDDLALMRYALEAGQLPIPSTIDSALSDSSSVTFSYQNDWTSSQETLVSDSAHSFFTPSFEFGFEL